MRELLADSTFPGMKVLQFAFGGGDSEYLPHNHVKNSVVYPGTHDNTTLTAWWDESASAKEKAVAAAYLHLTGYQPTAKEVAAVRTEAARTALLRAALALWPTVPSSPWPTGWAWARKPPEQPRQAGRKLELARRRWVRHCRAGQAHSGGVRRVLPYRTGPETRSVFSSLTKM